MIDYEKELAGAVVAEFAPWIDLAQVKVNESTNPAIRAQTVAAHSRLVDFRNEVVTAVVAEARTRHIGWQEQNPHEAHVHLPVLRAIERITTGWQLNRSVDYGQVNARVANIVKGLAKPHAYEYRWDMATRLEAERKAAAEAAAAEEDQTKHTQHTLSLIHI